MITIPIVTILLTCSLVFLSRWYHRHMPEFLDGVKPSERLDADFWLFVIFGIAEVLCIIIATATGAY